MAVTITGDMSGQQCTFRSKSASDTRTWTGVIEAVDATYRAASAFENLAAYNDAVRKTDATVAADPTTLKYFLFTRQNADGTSSSSAFCADWILDGSFTLISPKVSYTVVVYGSDSQQANNIITALRASGYQAYVTAQSS